MSLGGATSLVLQCVGALTLAAFALFALARPALWACHRLRHAVEGVTACLEVRRWDTQEGVAEHGVLTYVRHGLVSSWTMNPRRTRVWSSRRGSALLTWSGATGWRAEVRPGAAPSLARDRRAR